MEATKEIDWLAAEVVAPVMKQHGFKRRRFAFSRSFSWGFDLLVLQKGSWNTRSDARFTINLGICWTKAQELMGRPVKGFPFSELHCTVGDRIGFLMSPPKDRWWIISENRHVLDLPKEILDSITRFALPWFETGHDIDTSIRLAQKHHHQAAIRALNEFKHEWIG
jgi:hypothetical protein